MDIWYQGKQHVLIDGKLTGLDTVGSGLTSFDKRGLGVFGWMVKIVERVGKTGYDEKRRNASAS